ncbi:MAG: GHKL domain-containing protein [Proteobacteria bacterium]|nr:MAG: GHKL domain-containing protein [Pseudomonadota bacterium]
MPHRCSQVASISSGAAQLRQDVHTFRTNRWTMTPLSAAMKLMSERKRKFYVILVLGALVASCLAIAFKDYNKEAEQHHAALMLLNQARDSDRLIDENVLLTRSFMLLNYDSMVAATTKLLDICRTMTTDDGFNLPHEYALKSATQVYCSEVRTKVEVIEEYKTANSLLRNARAHIPVIVDRFQKTAFDERSDHLMIFIFRYFIEQIGENRDSIENSAKWIQIAKKDSRYRESALSLEHSLNILLDSFSKRSQLESMIFSNALRESFATLEATYLKVYDRHEDRAERFRNGLIGLSIFLAFALFYIVHKLLRTTDALNELNETLEHKVLERTSDLETAMQQLAVNQQVLTQSTKMSALGEMAGGIAHEINTPLASILLTSEMLQRSTQRDEAEKIQKGLANIIKTVQRISKIVVGLRRFSRDSSAESARSSELSSVIEETLILCGEKLKHSGIAVTVDEKLIGCYANCVPEQVSQVILNLINNSFDAVQELPEKWIQIKSRVSESKVYLSVIDSGLGIPEPIQKKLMQPFFTTKELGKGTGLGLSISKGLIEAHGGELHYDSSCRNTCFVITLPSATEMKAPVLER